MDIYAGFLLPTRITQCPSQAGGIRLGSMAKMGIFPHFCPFPGEKKGCEVLWVLLLPRSGIWWQIQDWNLSHKTAKSNLAVPGWLLPVSFLSMWIQEGILIPGAYPCLPSSSRWGLTLWSWEFPFLKSPNAADNIVDADWGRDLNKTGNNLRITQPSFMAGLQQNPRNVNLSMEKLWSCIPLV